MPQSNNLRFSAEKEFFDAIEKFAKDHGVSSAEATRALWRDTLEGKKTNASLKIDIEKLELEQRLSALRQNPNTEIQGARVELTDTAPVAITTGSSHSEPVAYDCFWNYKVSTGISNGRVNFETAQCMPKSVDNSLRVDDLKGFCKVCPVFLANSRLIRTGQGSAANLAINVTKLSVKQKALEQGEFVCEKPECTFRTTDMQAARDHTKVGFEHYFDQELN